MSVLALDIGRTHCRAARFTAGVDAPAGPVRTGPSLGTLADPDGPARVATAVTAALAGLGGGAGPAVRTVAVAVAGSLTRPEAATALAARLAGQLGQPVGQVLVTSDVVAAHAGVFAGGHGVLLAAGTGAVALAIGPGGQLRLVDGGGYLVGDAGSGFAIGRAGLAAALRHGDGRAGGSAALASAAERLAGPAGTLRAVVAELHGGDAAGQVARVASFAPEVATAARAGDPVAAGIWRQASAELAETVRAACAGWPASACRAALVGALFEVDDLLVAPLRAALAGQVEIVTGQTGAGDALAGAARLAWRRPDEYEQLVSIASAGTPAGADQPPARRPVHLPGGGHQCEVKEG